MRELIDRLGEARVLVIGDLILDEYIWGEVRRISPEAPVPVVEVRGRTHVAGGAGNTAAGVAALGGNVALGGVVGDDEAGRTLRDVLAACDIDCGGVHVVAGRVTSLKTRVIARSQQVVRADWEERSELPDDAEAAVLSWVEREVAEAGAVIVSDYAKGVVSQRVARAVIDLATARDRPVVVDPKGHDYAKYRGATILTPNVHEAERAAHRPVESAEDLVVAAAQLARVLEGSALLITRGADGMTLYADGAAIAIPAEAQHVYDVTGAGDTVVAILAAGLAVGASLEAAVRLANTAAGIAVSKVGTATVTLDELRAR